MPSRVNPNVVVDSPLHQIRAEKAARMNNDAPRRPSSEDKREDPEPMASAPSNGSEIPTEQKQEEKVPAVVEKMQVEEEEEEDDGELHIVRIIFVRSCLPIHVHKCIYSHLISIAGS